MNSLLFWYVWMWQALTSYYTSNNGWVIKHLEAKKISKAMQWSSWGSVWFLHCWSSQSVTRINQLLPGDAGTNLENRLVLSHSFSRENMILGAWAFQVLTVWVSSCQACRHGVPIFQHARISNFLLPFPGAKLKMAAFLSVSVGSLQ